MYVNYHFAKENAPKNPLFGLAYLSAHELLHQLIAKSTCRILGSSAFSEYLNKNGGHDDSHISLAMSGPELVRRNAFPQNSSSKLRSAESIPPQQRSLILLYLFENSLNKKNK